jgi:hypothetical protein
VRYGVRKLSRCGDARRRLGRQVEVELGAKTMGIDFVAAFAANATVELNTMMVVPGATTMGGIRGGLGSASTLTIADVEALRREAPAVGSVSYLIRQMGQVQYANQNWTTNIQGVSANHPPITNWQIETGRGISHEDDSSAALIVRFLSG